MTYRIVDFALGKQKMDAFDFEITTLRLPGTHGAGRRIARTVRLEGGRPRRGHRNVWGIADPAVDALLQKVVTAKTRPELGAAMRALDRVLTHGYYSVPQYYGDAFLIGYRPRRFVLPAVDAAVLPARHLGHEHLVGVARQQVGSQRSWPATSSSACC